MTEAEFRELKKGGMMRQREAGLFSVRLHLVGGQLSAAQLGAIRDAAERFGRGEVHLTARQGVEVPHVPLESLGAVRDMLASTGVSVGTCGPTVRTVTACQGCTVCPSGVVDAPALARALDREFYGRGAPHKFKFAVTGCANNCMKVEENDIGVKGFVEPGWRPDDCTYCGLCETACPARVIRVEDGVAVHLDGRGCIGCGDCIEVCPSGAMSEAARGFSMYAGGKFGRMPRLGVRVLPILRSPGEVVAAAAAILDFFRRHGRPGERFADTLGRTGVAALEAEVLPSLKAEAS